MRESLADDTISNVRNEAHVGSVQQQRLAEREALAHILELAGAGTTAERVAGQLIERWGSFVAAASATPGQLKLIAGLTPKMVVALKAVRQAIVAALRADIVHGDVLANSEAVKDYLRVMIGYIPHEQIRVLFLNSRNRLIQDIVVANGSVNNVNCPPREILRLAIELGAASLILVHNHPSGDPIVSPEDVQYTRLLKEACRTIEVDVHDHIIATRSGCISLRDQTAVL